MSSSEEEWEDVERIPVEDISDETKATLQPLEIVLSKDACQRGRKQNVLDKAMAEFNRNLRYSLHKASLLCLLVQGLEISRCCNDTLLQARLFSLVPRELLSTPAEKLFKILKWFVARKDHLLAAVTGSEESSQNQKSVSDQRKILERCQLNATEMLVVLLRALNLRTRLVLALNPISFKPSREKKSDPQLESTQSEAGKRITPSQREPAALPHSLTEVGNPSPSPNFFKLMERLKQNSDSNMDCTTEERGREGCDREYTVNTEHSLRGGSKRRAKFIEDSAVKKRRIDASKNENLGMKSGSCEQKKMCRSVGRKGKGRKQVSEKKDSSTASETSPYFGQEKAASHTGSMADGGSSDGSDDADFLLPLRRKSSQRLSFTSDSSSSDDGEGVEGGGEGGNKEGKVARKHPKKAGNVKEKTSELKGNKKNVPTSPCGVYDESSSWAEVFSEDQKKYVCLHLPSSSVGQPKMCEKHCPHKISYIIGIENGKFRPCVSDVTARYASDWCTATRRLRLSESWWKETLEPYALSKEERELEEEDIMSILHSHPLPTSVSDYKSHPLYVLRRHLLKFEAIYPVDSEILGYCKSEPVYSRSCVFTLHTRETWLKEGRVVKKDEQPYKVVKARPKKGQTILEKESSMVEVFGRWQTEVYVPPPVVDGIVPRNEYGNVELFQPSMLPAGACHIRIAGINKVARKLGLSYAPAMIGWDFHSGHCCPVIDGIVVAQENEEVLLEAWRQEEQLLIEKQMKKRESRLLERWKKLVRGVLIRERVKRTYSLT